MSRQRAMAPVRDPNRWDRSHGTYLTGQAAIDGADAVAAAMERHWGCGRLRLLVATELREKFDRQRYLYAQAIQHGEMHEVVRESARMVTAWQALDRAAQAAGHAPLAPEVWEVVLADGTVAAVVRTGDDARAVTAQGRQVAVYSMTEIGELLSGYKTVVAMKQIWPGATVERVAREIQDPLHAIDDPTGLTSPLDGDGDDIPL